MFRSKTTQCVNYRNFSHTFLTNISWNWKQLFTKELIWRNFFRRERISRFSTLWTTCLRNFPLGPMRRCKAVPPTRFIGSISTCREKMHPVQTQKHTNDLNAKNIWRKFQNLIQWLKSKLASSKQLFEWFRRCTFHQP